jgi:hypothetical protein
MPSDVSLSLISPSIAVGVLAVAFAGGPPGCARKSVPRTTTTPVPSSVVVHFEHGDASPTTDVRLALLPIATHLASNPRTRIVVVGFANDRRDLEENLALAERRARTVARQLMAWTVTERQITVAAVEAPPGDEDGTRCEVDVIDDGPATSSDERQRGRGRESS